MAGNINYVSAGKLNEILRINLKMKFLGITFDRARFTGILFLRCKKFYHFFLCQPIIKECICKPNIDSFCLFLSQYFSAMNHAK